MANNRGMIAKNIAAMLYDGDFVNLGIGIPTMVGNYIPKGISVLLHGKMDVLVRIRNLIHRSFLIHGSL